MNSGADWPPPEADPEVVEDLHARARALDPAARAAFLADACRGNQGLEQELRSLLACDQSAEEFFANLATTLGSPGIGYQVGRYRLLGVLGSGGMGTVYRAHDEQLDRVVALKFLPYSFISQPQARTRFLQEARAAAALEHPNVCTVHEIGETADGRPFIAMACYDGESLQDRLRRGAIPPVETIGIALQLARGLGAAHAHGIVHRDMKPGNVMILPDGTARLLDFGIARVSDANMTGPGIVSGTVAYMSPEQAKGDTVDARSDLWSLGVVLYEMLSGSRPFRGGSDQAVLQAIFHDPPAPLNRTAPRTPRWLSQIVNRLLQKAPEHRYQNAEEVIRGIERAASAGLMARARDWNLRHRWGLSLMGVGTLALLLLWGWTSLHSSARTGPPDPGSSLPTIAIMPFTVRGPDLEPWREGMVDLLSMGLDGAAGIRTVDSRTLLARWHEAVSDRQLPSLDRVLDVARQGHAGFAVVGSAVAAGARIRLTANVYEVPTERDVGPVQVEGPTDSVLALVDRLGMQVLSLILERQPGDVSALDLASVTTSSLLALNAYLKGEEYYRRSEFSPAIEAWQGAVKADTLFALAYVGLADAYAWSANNDNNRQQLFVASLERAKALKDRLPPRERAMMDIRWGRQHGIPDVLATTMEAIQRYPDAADLWYELGEIYYHNGFAMGRPEDAEAAYRKAAGLGPRMAPYRAHLLDLAFVWRADSAQIARELEAYALLVPEDPRTRAARLIAALAFGDPAARAGAKAALAVTDPATAATIYHLLPHPRFRQLRDEVDSTLRPRLTEGDRVAIEGLMFKTVGLIDGRVHQALAMLEDSRITVTHRYAGAFYLALRGMPVPDLVLAKKLASARQDEALFSSRLAAISAAGIAAQLGDWKVYDTLMSNLRAQAARGRDRGDTTAARYWDWAIDVAQAHGLWRQGRKEEALRLFEHALPLDTSRFTLWSIGQLSLELGKTDQAERAFRALWEQDGTPAQLQLARILERNGKSAEAREAYQFVVDAWREADPELRPLVEEARQAVTRLSTP